jgi:hypothetical protein
VTRVTIVLIPIKEDFWNRWRNSCCWDPQYCPHPDGSTYNFTFTVLFTKDPYGDPLPGRALDSLMIDPQRGKYYTQLAFEDLPYYGLTQDFILKLLI